MTDTILLDLPPRVFSVPIARVAAAELARVAGFDENAIMELKHAVSEIVANRLPAGADLQFRAHLEEGRLTFDLPLPVGRIAETDLDVIDFVSAILGQATVAIDGDRLIINLAVADHE